MMQLLPNMICAILDGIGELRIARILRGLAIESDVTIAPENTLIILDEIQEVPAALQSLKYFSEDDRPSYYILAAGSLLGIAMHQGTAPKSYRCN